MRQCWPWRLMGSLFLVLCAAGISSAGALPQAHAQEGGVAPVAIRVRQALIDTAVEPLAIVDSVPGLPSSPWIVGWYRETGRLGVPGNAVMTGYRDWWKVGPSAVWLLDQLRPGNTIDLTGDDGNLYRYRIASSKTYDKDEAPLQEIFGESAEETLTLLTDTGPFDVTTGQYEQLVVIQAGRDAEPPARAPEVPPAALDSPPGCPVAPVTLDLPTSDGPYPFLVDGLPYPFPGSSQMGITAAKVASTDDVAAIDALLQSAAECDVAVREALALADGYLLALVGPAGSVPLEALTAVVTRDPPGITDETLARLFAYMLFVQGADGWALIPAPPLPDA